MEPMGASGRSAHMKNKPDNKSTKEQERDTPKDSRKPFVEEALDEALDDSFPASDPPAITETAIPRTPPVPEEKKPERKNNGCS